MYSELELFIWTKGGDTGCVLYHGSVKCLHLYMCYFLMIVIKQPNYNFLAIPHKLYIPRMAVVGNKSMEFANLCQCKLNSFANKNVCKQYDLMLSQVKWIINWGKFTKRRQRSLSIYRTSILTLNCMILSSLSDRDTYRKWGSGHTKDPLPISV